MNTRAFISGLRGAYLSADERKFLSEAKPWGVILFARNAESREQLQRLTSDVRDALENDEAPILIDQEGGRVQRIKAPHVTDMPPASLYGQLYAVNPLLAVEAATLGAKLIGLELRDCGVNVNCIPVLDIPVEGASEVIGDRALGTDADAVSTLGRAVADGLEAVGVKPVMKHIPGHGRANADSHEALPVVDAGLDELDATDFVPFRMWARRIHMAMTAHIVFSCVDDELPATLSRRAIDILIRRHIGFHGALLSDDISMGALSGAVDERAGRAIKAGCDLVLHCNGDLAEMRAVAEAVPEVRGAARSRTQIAMKTQAADEPPERQPLRERFRAVLARAAA